MLKLPVNLIKSLAISLGVLLLLSGVLVTSNAQPVALTFLALDPIPSVVATGDEVTFTGTLTTLEGKGLANMTINIVEERKAGFNVLATAATDENGAFATTWIADVDDPARDRIMTVFASFNGAPGYAGAKSSTTGMRVAIQTMKVSFTFDKQTYFTGQIAIFTLKFSSPAGLPIDPESMRAIYDGVTVSLEKKSEGVYIYKTPPLVPTLHTLQVIAEKHGYKLFNDATTITVFAPQTLAGIRLNFDLMPKQIAPSVPVSFTLLFTDLNNVVTPFVNYDFTIKKGNEIILELPEEQTTDGSAAYMHTFEDSGKYRVIVRVNWIGQEDSPTEITQSFNFDIDVVKPVTFAVKAKAMQKGDVMRLTFRNPALATAGVYTLQLTLDDANQLKIRAPSGWSISTEDNAITINTSDSPIEPGKNLQLRAKVQGTVDSIDWSAMDNDGNELKSGTVKVRQLKIR